MRRTLAAACALLLSGAATAQSPLTPGAVVLLANSKEASASDTLRRALADGNRDVRRAAARVVAVAHPEAADALRDALQHETDADVVAEFVKDVMALDGAAAEPSVEPPARKAGADAVAEVAEWFARMDAAAFASHLAAWSEVSRIEARLTALVQLAIKCHPEARAAILAAWKPVASKDAYEAAAKPEKTNGQGKSGKGKKASPPVLLQTPFGLPGHLMRATLDEAGCVARGVFYGAIATYRPDGRPQSIQVPKELAAPCYAAVTAIAQLSNAYFSDPAAQKREVLVPMSDEILRCAERSDGEPLVPLAGQIEGVRMPRLVHEVKPDYNHEAMKQKLEGVVELEAVVSAEGCVADLRISRSLGVLDVQALNAVLQWRFDPARFAGRALPMLAYVELTFTLR